jgi:hypothetical protein
MDNNCDEQYARTVENLRQEIGIGKDKRTALLFAFIGLGDTWFGLSAIPNAERLLGKKLVVLYCNSRVKELAGYLSHGGVKIETHRITDENYKLLQNADRETALCHDEFLINAKFNAEVYKMLFNRSDVSQKSLVYPLFPPFDAGAYIRKYGVVPSKTVYIIPISYCIQSLPDYFWNFSAEVFRYIGYEVVFNVPDQSAKRFNGKNAFVPYRDAVGFANLCGNVFGMRTGFFDFISTSRARMTIFSTKAYTSLDEVYNINNDDGHIKTVTFNIQDLYYENFPPMKFMNEYVADIVSGTNEQSNISEMLSDNICFNKRDTYNLPHAKAYKYIPWANRTSRAAHLEILPFVAPEYTFSQSWGIVFFRLRNLNLAQNRLDLHLKYGAERKRTVRILHDHKSKSAKFMPLEPGEYSLEVVITDRASKNQTVFVTETVAVTPFVPENISELPYCAHFEGYADALIRLKDDALILIVSKDAHTKATPGAGTKKLAALKKLGIKTDMESTFRHSFLCAIDYGDTAIELCDEKKELTYDFNMGGGIGNIKLTSMGFNVKHSPNCLGTVEIKGIQYAVNKRGLNFVVYDKSKNEVVDSVCFDTFADGAASR